jgi:hypothetical protein
MTEHKAHGPEYWEEKINALLDGDLEPDDAEALKAEATDDQRLATAIIEAYQLQRAMEHVGMEKAPASLRRRLRRIPREHRPVYLQPRWAMAFAIVPLMVISIVLLQPREPSQAQIDQARKELAVAFAYIDRVSDRTFNRIEHEVGGELKNAVGASVIKSIPKSKSQTQLQSQENQA